MPLYSEVGCMGLGQFSIHLASFRRKKTWRLCEEAVRFRDTTSGALLWVPRPGEHRGGRDLHLQTINVMELCTIVCISMHTCLLGTLDPKKDAVIVWETTLHKLAKDIKALRVL